MNTTPSRKTAKVESWPRKVKPGRAIVPVYRRKTPQGNFAFMVANWSDGKRRFDSYANEADALAAAETLAKRIDQRDFVSANMTQAQAIEYADAGAALKPFNVTVRAGASAVAECLKMVGELPNLAAACKFYAARHKQTIKKPLADVIAELLTVKESRGAAPRYLEDLRSRLKRIAGSFVKDACNVTTADVQAWLDAQKFSGQGYTDYRRVLHLLFNHAVARSYAVDNPVIGTERVKVRRGETQVFTPVEIGRLLDAARNQFPDFLPCLAIGGFAGLRSAEIERLEWSDIHLAERFIVVGASKAKTAGRRIVPISDNLAEWLQTYAHRQGNIWQGPHKNFYNAQRDTARAAGMKWKSNALRHSYASYRFALTNDAGRVAGECGNSAAVIHRHYRELVKLVSAKAWFAIGPNVPANIVTMAAQLER